MAPIRLVLRVVGFLLIAAAFVAFVVDGTRVIAGGPVAAAPFATVVAALDPGPTPGTGLPAGAEWFWGWLLGAPAFAVLGVAGIVLMALGRSRRRPLSEQSWRA
ncbi:MAG TPA: hypothetical protein VHD15_06525 [Hyphomicrobiales bacterium]|nr:hypothetical protein [Hyphomicrobiales bacterium]